MPGIGQNQTIEQAVILTNSLKGDGGGAVPLLRVATMPVVLRSILTAKKAGATKFLVVLDSDKGPEIRRALEHHRRLPAGVEWLTLPEGQTSLTATLREVAQRVGDRFLLLPGEATFHASLLDQIKSPNGGGALALTVSDQPTGIYRFSRQTALAVASQAPPLQSLDDLNAWLNQARLLQREEVDEKFWQPIAGSEDLPKAEAKLDRWLFKETDGIYSRFNRKISIPISRVLIRLRITPNMVTLFTLLMSFVSGVFFALGGYVNGIIGALLSHWASVLDGSDGEVARLTFQESDFGCWLETMCDNFYYVFVFGGMVIGMYRASRSMVYPIAGGLLAFGTIMSFITTAYQRRTITRHQPEKYLAKWQKKMDAHQGNFFLRFARRHEFIIRRSFFPYAILFFAIFNILEVLFFLIVVGANLVWALALYSNRVFHHDSAAEVAERSLKS
ncbi:MAG: CDP-alcohol phosphatidyltransferase family protein [Acidobacteria bacterium]|nr:CDP-alcohol phosphatidyltransferase family protein [Acidobacteriota bacterium]